MTSSIKDRLSLFLLTLDERVDLYADVLDVTGKPSSAERERAAELKRVVFEGIRAAIEQGLPKPSVAIWADGDLGESVLLRAKAMSIATSASPGSGMKTLSHLFVDYIGIQLSFNPDSSHDTRKQLIKQLKILSDGTRKESIQLIVELDSSPTTTQIESFGNPMEARANLLVKAIQQLQDAGVNSAIWAINPEGIEPFVATLAAQGHIDGRHSRVLLCTSGDFSTNNIHGLTADEKRITCLAARTHGVDGLLIGPGAYYSDLVDYNAGNIQRDEAILSIANHLIDTSELFEQSRATSPVL